MGEGVLEGGEVEVEAAAASAYDASSIVVLEGLEAVRRRPGMYVGDTRDGSGLIVAACELIDNAVNEALEGFGDKVGVILHAGGAVTVADRGRGIPVEALGGRSAVEIIMTQIGGARRDDLGASRIRGTLWGLGCAVVNGCSAWLEVEVRREGRVWRQRYVEGKPQGPLAACEPCWESGTRITFLPDPTIFEGAGLCVERLLKAVELRATLAPEVEIVIVDEAQSLTHRLRRPRGLADALARRDEALGRQPLHPAIFHLAGPVVAGERRPRSEVALRWCAQDDAEITAICNAHLTPLGPHIVGLRRGLARALGALAGRRVRRQGAVRGLSAVIGLHLEDPRYAGATRERLESPEAEAMIADLIIAQLPARLGRFAGLRDAVVSRACAPRL